METIFFKFPSLGFWRELANFSILTLIKWFKLCAKIEELELERGWIIKWEKVVTIYSLYVVASFALTDKLTCFNGKIWKTFAFNYTLFPCDLLSENNENDFFLIFPL